MKKINVFVVLYGTNYSAKSGESKTSNGVFTTPN